MFKGKSTVPIVGLGSFFEFEVVFSVLEKAGRKKKPKWVEAIWPKI